MKGYIFDLDGTLLDSMDIWAKIDIAFLKKRGLPVPVDYAQKIASMSFKESAAYTIKRFGLADSVAGLIQEWNEMSVDAYAQGVRLKPHAKEYLALLKESGAKLAVATCSMPYIYEPALSNLGIFDWFEVICRADEVGSGKSSPQIYLYTANKLALPASDCLVFEDLLVAIKSAKSAGMKTCGVYEPASANHWQQIKDIADYAIQDFCEAPRPYI